MKFGHLLAQTAVPEWSREYIDYKSLKVLIRAVTAEAVTLVRAYDTVLKLTDDVIDDNVQLTQLPAEQAFFERLEDQVANAESFYRQRLIEAVQNFFLLVQASIEQGLIAEFVPYQPDGNSRLVRELARLDLHCNVQFVVDRADDNSGQYRLPSMTIGMSAKDIRLPRFDDIVFVRRRARTAPVDARDVAALTHAAQVGDIATIRTLLAESSVGANSTIDAHGRTALFVAVAHEQIDAIALLLDAGADVARCDSTGRTPLDVASEIGRDDIVQMLLNEHSSGNVKDTAPHMKRVVDMRLREKAAKNVAGAVATRPAHSARSIHGNRRDDDNASEIEMVPLIEEGRVGDDSGDNDDNDDYESSSEDDDDDDDDIAIVKPRIQLASTTSGSDTSLSSEELKRANLFAHLRRRFASNDAMTSLQAAFIESYRGLVLLRNVRRAEQAARSTRF
jgi:hypothetical protein